MNLHSVWCIHLSTALTCGASVQHAVHGVHVADLSVLLFGALIRYVVLLLIIMVTDGRVARVHAECAWARALRGPAIVVIVVVVTVESDSSHCSGAAAAHQGGIGRKSAPWGILGSSVGGWGWRGGGRVACGLPHPTSTAPSRPPSPVTVAPLPQPFGHGGADHWVGRPFLLRRTERETLLV